MPRNKHPEETRQKIIDAAKQVFLDKGYENTTILDIVDNMDGLTRGAFYHHFKSKEEVLDVIGDELFYANNPFDTVQNKEGLTGAEKLEMAIFNSLHHNLDEESLALMEQTKHLISDPFFVVRQIEFNRTLAQSYVQPLMEEGMADGSIEKHNPKWMAELLVMLLNFWTNPFVSPSTPEELVDKLIFIATIFEELGCPIFNELAAVAAEDVLALYYPDVDVDVLRDKIGEHEMEVR